MSKIFLIDTEKRPLNPIHPAQARQMLRNGKAAIFRRFPFTLILKRAQPETLVDKLRIKISTPHLIAKNIKPLLIKAEGNGNRKLCITDKFGFPKKHRPRKKLHFGFRTGDIVKAVVTKGKNAGTYIGRVAIRSNGSFDISIKDRHKKQGVSYKYCQTVHRKDGYSYVF